ncbi:MAG: cupin-like domain-containing protein [Chakrabartia sp.]
MPTDLPAPIQEVVVADKAALDTLLQGAKEPFVVRGLVADWPLVVAGLSSGREARDYLLARQKDRPFTVSIGPSEARGRIFYDDNMAVNIRSGRTSLREIFGQIDASETHPAQPIVYCGSIDMHAYFEGLHEANHVALGDRNCIASIWMGTPSRIAAHNDFPDNLACVAVGRRRFTLFPPDQFRNLYLGPVDNTPAGRAISMVDFHQPDFEAYPRFRDALAKAQIAELAPGDAIFIPSMWWHHVEGLDPFNVLINYWWRETPRYLGQPQDALNHAMMAIRDLPEQEKHIWRDLFDHFVFANNADVTEHIPEAARGILGPMTVENATKIRSFLLKALNQ